MTERLRGQSPEQHTYIPASELPESGYWFGWNYKGPYAGKIKVNPQAIEGIMRAANLPPIRIVADRYRPPEKAEADVMGMTEGGEAFMGQSQTPRFRWNQSEVRHGYFQLETMDEQIVAEGEPVSVGWLVKMSGDALYDEVRKKYSNEPENVKIQKFSEAFDRKLREAVLSISLWESLAVRLPPQRKMSERTTQFMFNAMHTYNAVSERSLPAFAFYQLVDYLMFAGVIQRTMHGRDTWMNARGLHNVSMYSSAEWRKIRFPEEYKAEQRRTQGYIRNRLLTVPVPFATLLHSVYQTWAAEQLQKAPLVMAV